LSPEEIENYIESHYDVMSRVLYVYASLDKGVKYAQGMNEVIAVLYFCFWKFGTDGCVSEVDFESQLFFCFSNLMAELKDGFMRELDTEVSGVKGRISIIEGILEVVDSEVYIKLMK